MRRQARISHDEVTRIVKAVMLCGLKIERVDFDGATLSVVIAQSDRPKQDTAEAVKLLREPRL